ncbi:DUF1499 domain-containing protein [Rhodobacteraceae bacterium GS-10]|uniref:DUF1499 domain-containing protein n=2 Tax=Thalassovita mangrovi TaxID=2692236 RepID=A0A6L8LD50_9RHOB|nr:DUF1499 domain-containing protein [Thalassovita mangrovi]MYM53984.1 DUF1499 domain-containing protein [Thalassovita mangrovi]
MAYVRLSPNDPARWHQPVRGDQDKSFENGVIRVLPGSAEDFAQLHKIASSWPRTKVLAGSVAEGRITYVTRTAFWGFPDFTTVERRDGQIALYARARFGRSDLGVNGKRVQAWIDALAQR